MHNKDGVATMNYEMTVLAALVQLEKPTKPKITEKTGISDRRVKTALKNLRDTLGIRISRLGPNKTGFYLIDSWGAFESGKKIRRKALALDLNRYKLDRSIQYDSSLLKKNYSDEVKLSNYRQSLKLEGFHTSGSAADLNKMSKSERQQLRTEMKRKFSRQIPTPGT